MFLSVVETAELTGYKRPSHQIRWLSEHGYRFEVNALGRPVVLVSCVEQRLAPRASHNKKPNFDALTNG